MWFNLKLGWTYVVGYSNRCKIGKQSDEHDEIGTDGFVENDHLLELAAMKLDNAFEEHLPK